MNTNFCSISANGKSIGEVRAGLDEKFNSEPSVADAFFGLLNYKKNQYGKAAVDKCYKIFNLRLTPHFANTMLSAVFF
ncbi:hypothetical protein G6R40_02125 [Chryseobacterium sp. POL2]|uniref:hypothetical protein n=1 Tax=Chryseobacterium sp. POL2 TaxID=2713414 RepID=UPI0013E1FDEE|nr:hypothetical protein [Chryseobacterium sp. POL2]QIG88529.1 hypothetical protein G6R40_02125 [Chryseobacterium sp. POL2]